MLKIFNSHAVLNSYIAPLIYSIAKKTVDDEIGQAFITKAVKDCLHSYSVLETQKKNPKIAQPQPMYFNFKGNSEKLTEEEIDSFKTKEKEAANTIALVDKLCDLVKALNLDSLSSTLRDQVLEANAYIKKNNFKVAAKGITALIKKFSISKEEEQSYEE